MKKKRIMRKKGLAIGLVDVYAFTWFIVTVMVFFIIFGVMKSCSSQVCFAKEMAAGLVTGESKDCELNIIGAYMSPLKEDYNANSLMRMPLKVDGHDMTMAELIIYTMSQSDDERLRPNPDLPDSGLLNQKYYDIIWSNTIKAIKPLYSLDTDCVQISLIHKSQYQVRQSERTRTMGHCLRYQKKAERWTADIPFPPGDNIHVQITFKTK